MSTETATRPLLVGEANPYGADPEFALYPEPRHASGSNLCRKIMGLRGGEYLARFDRANLCPSKWSIKVARERAEELLGGPWTTYVLLGSKVRQAFGVKDYFGPLAKLWVWDRFVDHEHPAPLDAKQKLVVLMPHPSGLCRFWNEPNAFEHARELLRGAGVL